MPGVGYKRGRRYEELRGRQIVCALTHDFPVADCSLPKIVADGGGYHSPAKCLSSLCVSAWASPGSSVTATITPVNGPAGGKAKVKAILAQLAALLGGGHSSDDPAAPNYKWSGYWLTWVLAGPGTYEVTLTSKRHKNSTWEVVLTTKQQVVVPPMTPNVTFAHTWPGINQLQCLGPNP